MLLSKLTLLTAVSFKSPEAPDPAPRSLATPSVGFSSDLLSPSLASSEADFELLSLSESSSLLFVSFDLSELLSLESLSLVLTLLSESSFLSCL